MAGRIILFEGLDLAGKSTLVAAVREELTRRGLPVRVGRNALCPDNPIAALADEVRRDGRAGLVETGALFLAAHFWDARHFVPPADGVVHLQDSCWLRTLAYHTYRGTPRIPDLLREAAEMPRFDAMVFLTASVEERRRRLVKRERDRPGSNDANDHLVVTDPTAFLGLEAALRDCVCSWGEALVIDTTDVASAALVWLVIDDVFGG